MKTFLSFIFTFVFFAQEVIAQDAQFSQFYAAPLYLNPAFTGSSHGSRFIANYRNQWPTAGKSFISYATSFDHYFAKFNSGAGLMVMQNKEGTSKLKSTEISGFYSYHISLNEQWTVIPALQATYVLRSIDYSNVTFPDQLNNSGITGPSAEPINTNNKSYADFSTGGLLFSDVFWFGAAYHHLNHPNQTFTNNLNRLPGEINFNAGARIPFASSGRGRSTQRHYKDKAIIPSVLYKSQGKFDQLDISVYMVYEPIMIGVWYRGLPIKHYKEGFTNSESIIGMVGFNYNNFTIGYSYDFVISRLNMRSGGAHELSIIYQFGEAKENFKKKVKYKRLPCPSFYKSH